MVRALHSTEVISIFSVFAFFLPLFTSQRKLPKLWNSYLARFSSLPTKHRRGGNGLHCHYPSPRSLGGLPLSNAPPPKQSCPSGRQTLIHRRCDLANQDDISFRLFSCPGRMFSYCVRARAYTHVLACVYSTCASTCTIYTCFTLPPTCVKLTGLQLSVFFSTFGRLWPTLEHLCCQKNLW